MEEFDIAPVDRGTVFDLSEIIKFKKLLPLIKGYPGYNLVLSATQKLQSGYYEELLGLMSIKAITPDIVENILRSKKKNRLDSSPTKRRMNRLDSSPTKHRMGSKPTFTYFLFPIK